MNWFQNKLTELRNSSPARKMRWVIGLTSVSMVLVLVVWVLSIDDVVSLGAPTRALSLSSPEKAKQESPLYKLRKRTAQTILYFQGKFEQKNEFNIELPQQDLDKKEREILEVLNTNS